MVMVVVVEVGEWEGGRGEVLLSRGQLADGAFSNLKRLKHISPFCSKSTNTTSSRSLLSGLSF